MGSTTQIKRLVELLVDDLRNIPPGDPKAYTLEAGRLIVQRLFQGNVANLHHPALVKEYSYLIAHPRLPLSRTSVWRAVRAYEMACRIPWVRTCDALTVTHLRAVLGIDPALQEDMLKMILEEGWSSEKTVAEVDTFFARSRSGRGATPRLVAAAGKVITALDGLSSMPEPEALKASHVETLQTALQAVESFRGLAQAALVSHEKRSASSKASGGSATKKRSRQTKARATG